MGEVWNSHLPKPGAGRPRGARNGVLRPGIKGGVARGGRSQAAKDADPLHIPGNGAATSANHAALSPAWANTDLIAVGQRKIHEALHEARNRDKVEKVVNALLDKAGNGDYKAAELVLAYYGGKPVAYVSRQNSSELTGDSVASMAEAVAAQLDSKGLRLVKREPLVVPAADEETA